MKEKWIYIEEVVDEKWVFHQWPKMDEVFVGFGRKAIIIEKKLGCHRRI